MCDGQSIVLGRIVFCCRRLADCSMIERISHLSESLATMTLLRFIYRCLCVKSSYYTFGRGYVSLYERELWQKETAPFDRRSLQVQGSEVHVCRFTPFRIGRVCLCDSLLLLSSPALSSSARCFSSLLLLRFARCVHLRKSLIHRALRSQYECTREISSEDL